MTVTIRLGFLSLSMAVLSTGCAAPQAAHVPTEVPPEAGPRREAARLQAAQREAETRLDELQADTAPDCPRACEIKEVICDLARRICAIADRHQGDPELHERCQDATRRCQRASQKVDTRCDCDPPGSPLP